MTELSLELAAILNVEGQKCSNAVSLSICKNFSREFPFLKHYKSNCYSIIKWKVVAFNIKHLNWASNGDQRYQCASQSVLGTCKSSKLSNLNFEVINVEAKYWTHKKNILMLKFGKHFFSNVMRKKSKINLII